MHQNGFGQLEENTRSVRSADNIDQVRELLFGEQQRRLDAQVNELDQRIARIEENVLQVKEEILEPIQLNPGHIRMQRSSWRILLA